MHKTYTIPYKRRRLGKTNYRTRLKLIKSKTTRLVIRRSNKHLFVQAVNYDQNGDKVLIVAHTRELLKLGWKFNTKNISASYLCGLLFGKKWKGKETLIPDIGQYTSVKGCKLYALIKGIVDAGVKVAHSPEVFPSEERISGSHIANYGKIKNAKDIKNNFTEIKKKIMGA